MRSFKEFIKDVVIKPPMMFPMVGGIHVLWLAWLIWSNHAEPFPNLIWLGVAWMMGYTVCWIAACDLRKWGALGYMFLTLLNSSLYLARLNGNIATDYISDILLIDALFSFFLLYYFKRFR